MARPYWSGKIHISLVSFGVRILAAARHAPTPHKATAARKCAQGIPLVDALRKPVNDTKITDTPAAPKPASRKGPTLMRAASMAHPHREVKPTRTSPRRKTA